MISIVIHGTGRMGQAVSRACKNTDDMRVAGAVAHAAAQLPAWPQAAFAVALTELAADFDVVIDFSSPEGAVAIAQACSELNKPLVCGTTGLDASQRSVLKKAAEQIPLVYAPNMSAGVALLLDLVHRTATTLGEDADVEILETHHRHKKDAPSGTAIRLGEQVAAAWDANFEERVVYDRNIGEERKRGAIGMASLRGGDIVGEHQVLFALEGERLELGHRATDRGIFAQGALRAVRWIVQQAPGRYTMRDVLGL